MGDILVEGVSFSSNPIQKGNAIGLFGKVTNTSSKKQQVNLSFTAESDCDNDLHAIGGTNKIQLDAGRAVFVSVSWLVPPSACTGTYTVTLHAETPKEDFSVFSNLEVID